MKKTQILLYICLGISLLNIVSIVYYFNISQSLQSPTLFTIVPPPHSSEISMPDEIALAGEPTPLQRQDVQEALAYASEKGILMCAICAAPKVLGKFGYLEGKKATCFPGFEENLLCAQATGERVVTDGNIITSKGMGTTIELGLKLLEILVDKAMSEEIGKAIMFLK